MLVGLFNKGFFNKSIYQITFLLLAAVVFSVFWIVSQERPAIAQVSPDTIAVRVMPNPEHYSAKRWYEMQGFKGSPQSIVVDGYQGIRDGRSAYVNAANISGGFLHTNIYILSYNDQAEKQTRDIFGQMLKNWRFNIGVTAQGTCRRDSGQICVSDNDCAIGDHCDGIKSVIIRDTLRLSHLADISSYLEEHRVRHGHFPILGAGSYLKHRSLSVWPSWRDRLSKDLGVTLPVDPVNALAVCPGYDEITCWNNNNQTFAFPWASFPAQPSPFNNNFAYVYYANENGSEMRICGIMESGLTVGGDQFCIMDICIDLDGDGYGRYQSNQCPRPGVDCNDNDPTIGPAAASENCTNGIDDNCNGFIDCADPDCLTNPNCTPFAAGDSRFCYDGPEGSLGRGPCRGGTQTYSGGAWGTCQGQVLPMEEDCSSGIDRNCNGLAACDDPVCFGTVHCPDGCLTGQTRSCYGGLPATRNVGACRDGTQTCNSGAWGACIGEITPTAENCSNNNDLNCNGLPGCSDSVCIGSVECPPPTPGSGPTLPGGISPPPSLCSPTGCDGVCPPDCTSAEDPDCGCVSGNGCCGIGCTHLNDSDCSPPPPTCTPTGCDGVCPPNCTAAQDPDCGCVSGNGCCGIGCTHLNDSDCSPPPPTCTPTGCDGVCPPNCTVAQDPDCGCVSGNGCCGITGCTHLNDSDCVSQCVFNATLPCVFMSGGGIPSPPPPPGGG